MNDCQSMTIEFNPFSIDLAQVAENYFKENKRWPNFGVRKDFGVELLRFAFDVELSIRTFEGVRASLLQLLDQLVWKEYLLGFPMRSCKPFSLYTSTFRAPKMKKDNESDSIYIALDSILLTRIRYEKFWKAGSDPMGSNPGLSTVILNEILLGFYFLCWWSLRGAPDLCSNNIKYLSRFDNNKTTLL